MAVELDESTGCSTMSPRPSSGYHDFDKPIDKVEGESLRSCSPVDFSRLQINLDPDVALSQATKHQDVRISEWI